MYAYGHAMFLVKINEDICTFNTHSVRRHVMHVMPQGSSRTLEMTADIEGSRYYPPSIDLVSAHHTYLNPYN